MLLIDAGNSRIKWARLEHGELRNQGSVSHDGQVPEITGMGAGQINQRAVIGSVAGATFNNALQAHIEQQFGARCRFLSVESDSFGLQIAYENPEHLGVDRWLAMLAARELSRGAVCVADAGTALTVDAVTMAGEHLGGAIAPGVDTMLRSILTGTANIRDAADPDSLTEDSLFAADTGPAVAAGAVFAAASLIDRAVRLLAARQSSPVTLFVTGGGADSIVRLLESDYERVPDLVLRGIARVAVEEGGDLH